MCQRDPTGTSATLIRSGLALPGDLTTAISDGKNVSVHGALKRVQQHQLLGDLLWAEQKQAYLETVDPDSTTTGERQYYNTGLDSAVYGNRSFLPAIVLYFQFEFN